MTVHAVYVPEHLAPDPAVAVEAAEIVRERFSVAAFLFGPLWLLRHRAWPELVGFFLLTVAVVAALRFFPALSGEAGELYLLFALFIGFASADIRGRALERRGFRLRDVVVATKPDEALLRFGERASAFPAPAAPTAAAPASRTVPVRDGDSDVIGLFPEARR